MLRVRQRERLGEEDARAPVGREGTDVALQGPEQAASESAATLALLAEQRRTNRLLQGLLFGLFGFVAGVAAVRLWAGSWPPG